MSKEGQPLQHDMFSGELVDTRTRRQKKLDREREQPKQMEMFSQRDVAQFGVNAHPLLPLSPNTKLLLIPEDPRTEEEMERDLQRAAEQQTYRM
ncbi:MAG: hypothetical protein AB1435_06940, partial [Chloroflexota bacterium]